MSRIGTRPIPVPSGVTVNIKGSHVAVKGPKGNLERELAELIAVEQEGNEIKVSPKNDSRTARQLHGLSRTLVANMVEGVAKGFEKRLQIIGVGYRAQAQGQKLTLNVGYSKLVEMVMPPGIQVAVEKNTDVIVTGIDKEVVGNVSAKIRAVRPPEPYKGKGIRYQDEVVRRKAGKTGK